MADESKPPQQKWYHTAPGYLTATAALVGSITAAVTGLSQLGVFHSKSETPPAAVAPAAAPSSAFLARASLVAEMARNRGRRRGASPQRGRAGARRLLPRRRPLRHPPRPVRPPLRLHPSLRPPRHRPQPRRRQHRRRHPRPLPFRKRETLVPERRSSSRADRVCAATAAATATSSPRPL